MYSESVHIKYGINDEYQWIMYIVYQEFTLRLYAFITQTYQLSDKRNGLIILLTVSAKFGPFFISGSVYKALKLNASDNIKSLKFYGAIYGET